MPLPSLPREIWLSILSLLEVSDLHRVSLVSLQFHALATHPSLFHLHLPPLPADIISHFAPATLYRRLNSYQQPFLKRPIRLNGRVLTLLADYVVLLRDGKIGTLGGRKWIRNEWGQHVAHAIVPLLNNTIGIVDARNRGDGTPKLTMFNLQTDTITVVNLPPHQHTLTIAWTKASMKQPKLALPACNGTHICYLDGNKLTTVDLTGRLYSSIAMEVGNNDASRVLCQLVRGEYGYGSVIEGIVRVVRPETVLEAPFNPEIKQLFAVIGLDQRVISFVTKHEEEQLVDMMVDSGREMAVRRSIIQSRMSIIRTKLAPYHASERVFVPPHAHDEWKMSTSEPPIAMACMSLAMTQRGRAIVYVNLPAIRVLYIEMGCVQVHQFVSKGAEYDFAGVSFDAKHVVTAIQSSGAWGLTALQPVKVLRKGSLGGCKQMLWGGAGLLVQGEGGEWMACGWGKHGYSEAVGKAAGVEEEEQEGVCDE